MFVGRTMSAPKNQAQDPFLPPGAADAETPDLAELPSRAKQTVDITPPPRLAINTEPPRRRKPLKYKRPGTSWVTFVVLGFAAVGMSAIGGTVLKKIFGTKEKTPAAMAEEHRKATGYSTISRDDAVLVTVVVSPRDARLMLDGEHTVSNPLRFLRSKTAHKLSVSAPGYAPAIQEIVPDAHKTIRLNLKKQR
jgi:hypothetical protein